MLVEMENLPNLTVLEDSVEDLIVDEHSDVQQSIKNRSSSSSSSNRVTGVTIGSGEVINADAVVITTGTFLRGMVHIGVGYIYICRRECVC